MLDWGKIAELISQNKEWLFSGLAISVFGGIGLLVRKGYLAVLSEQIDKRIHKSSNDKKLIAAKLEKKLEPVDVEKSSHLFEIQSYWGYRPAAHEDMKKDLYSAQNRIFVAGGGLTTIVNLINDPSFIASLSKRITKTPDFSFTIIMDFENEFSNSEEGRKGRAGKIAKRRKQLSEFQHKLSELVSEKIIRPLIHFKKYNDKVTPRHFLLAIDETIYIGSYLSHQEGQYSYLIKIRNTPDGVLYKLLNAEIDYVGKNATKFPLK